MCRASCFLSHPNMSKWILWMSLKCIPQQVCFTTSFPQLPIDVQLDYDLDSTGYQTAAGTKRLCNKSLQIIVDPLLANKTIKLHPTRLLNWPIMKEFAKLSRHLNRCNLGCLLVVLHNRDKEVYFLLKASLPEFYKLWGWKLFCFELRRRYWCDARNMKRTRQLIRKENRMIINVWRWKKMMNILTSINKYWNFITRWIAKNYA